MHVAVNCIMRTEVLTLWDAAPNYMLLQTVSTSGFLQLRAGMAPSLSYGEWRLMYCVSCTVIDAMLFWSGFPRGTVPTKCIMESVTYITER